MFAIDRKLDRNSFIELTIIQVNRCYSSQLKDTTDMNESDIQLITSRPYQWVANKWYFAIAFRPGCSTDDTIAEPTVGRISAYNRMRICHCIWILSTPQWPPVINSRHVSRFGQVIPPHNERASPDVALDPPSFSRPVPSRPSYNYSVVNSSPHAHY